MANEAKMRRGVRHVAAGGADETPGRVNTVVKGALSGLLSQLPTLRPIQVNNRRQAAVEQAKK